MATSVLEALAQQAGFVFQGTIVQLRAATMASVPVTNNTATVRIDEVVHAPGVLSGYAGRQITVELTGNQKLDVGQQAVFYTNTWLFGDSVAVQSVSEQISGAEGTTLLAQSADPVKNLRDRNLKNRIANADVVVTGKVISVSLPTQDVSMATAMPVQPRQFISEHDPVFHEAIVQVQAVHKGSPNQQTIVVRFPSSMDVRWHSAPKLRPGQQGVFLLNRDVNTLEASPPAVAAAALPQPSAAYIVQDPLDFIPADKANEVTALINAAPRS